MNLAHAGYNTLKPTKKTTTTQSTVVHYDSQSVFLEKLADATCYQRCDGQGQGTC